LAIPIANPKAQYLALKNEIDTAVQEVFEKCQFILGDNVKALEAEAPGVCDARFGIAVNSGTDAIVIALAANGVGPGDEVITTPYTFVATTEAIIIVGAKPVFADIDPDTFNISPEEIEKKITPKTKALLPVHLYGQCADISRIEAIAKSRGLVLVSDGAQAIGSKHDGKGIGAYGAASTLSFFPTKNLGACGDGGMVLTSDEAVAAKARSLRFHGMDETYSYEYVGYCSRLDELQAAILRVKLRRIEEWNEARRSNAAYYIRAFEGLPMTLPVSKPENFHTYHQFTLRYPRRDELKAMLGERGVGSAVYYPSPLHLQRAYAHLGHKQGDFPEAERAAAEVLSLPVHPDLSADDVKAVAEAVGDCVKQIES